MRGGWIYLAADPGQTGSYTGPLAGVTQLGLLPSLLPHGQNYKLKSFPLAPIVLQERLREDVSGQRCSGRSLENGSITNGPTKFTSLIELLTHKVADQTRIRRLHA